MSSVPFSWFAWWLVTRAVLAVFLVLISVFELTACSLPHSHTLTLTLLHSLKQGAVWTVTFVYWWVTHMWLLCHKQLTRAMTATAVGLVNKVSQWDSNKRTSEWVKKPLRHLQQRWALYHLSLYSSREERKEQKEEEQKEREREREREQLIGRTMKWLMMTGVVAFCMLPICFCIGFKFNYPSLITFKGQKPREEEADLEAMGEFFLPTGWRNLISFLSFWCAIR